MKKILSIILAAVMTAALALPAFAAEDSGLTQAVITVKNRIGIPEDYEDFSSNKNDDNGSVTYNMFWEKGGNQINASILDNGRIIGYYNYDSSIDYDTKGIAKFTSKQLEEKAREFAVRANPGIEKELSAEAEVGKVGVDSRTANVVIRRKINNIPVRNNYISFSVDKFTGKVETMYLSWQDHKSVMAAENVIDSETAEKALGDLIDFTLCYKRPSNSNTAIPVYCANNRYVMINALTGKEFTVSVDYDDEGGNGGGGEPEPSPRQESMSSADMKSLTEEEIKEINKMDSLISKAEIEKKIAEMADTALPSYEIISVRYMRQKINEDEYSYTVEVDLRGGNKEYANVRFDAEDGTLLSFYASTKSDSSSIRYSLKQRKATADRFIGKWASDIDGKLKVYDEADEKYGFFGYLRTENDVRYDEDGVGIRVDGATGQVISFNRDWNNKVEFASVDGIVDAETAKAKYFAHKPELTYVSNGMKYSYYNTAREAALVYVIPEEAPAYIDAVSGKEYDWSLGVYAEKNYTLQKDLDGHFAKTAVKTLADNGVVFTYEDEFRPNDTITQKEALLFIQQLNGSFRYGDVDYKIIFNICIQSGIISEKEKNPDAVINRETAACYLVRSLGYKKAAEIKGIFNAGFKDASVISADKVGYIAIARGLGIMNGDKAGNVNPKKNVTRGEFAVMLYNSLKK